VSYFHAAKLCDLVLADGANRSLRLLAMLCIRVAAVHFASDFLQLISFNQLDRLDVLALGEDHAAEDTNDHLTHEVEPVKVEEQRPHHDCCHLSHDEQLDRPDRSFFSVLKDEGEAEEEGYVDLVIESLDKEGDEHDSNIQVVPDAV
jgi:hypothetical protein